MSTIYGVVLIGCGHIGSAHLDEIYFRDSIKIIGVVDTDPSRAQLFAKKYGAASWSTDYHDYFDNKEATIFIIATYVSTHLFILKDCLAAHKHIICEKPIALNRQEGDAFYRLVQSSTSKVLVGLILRHNITYNHVANMIKSGMIGKVKLMRMVQNHHAMDWQRYKRLLEDCSPIIDCGVHYFDVMQWFTGAKIISVGGMQSKIDGDTAENTYNYGLVTTKLSDGCIAYYESGWGKNISSQNTKEFIGETGRIKIILCSDRTSNREEGDLVEYYNNQTKEYQTINIKSKYKDTYSQMNCLINMIESDTPANPTMDAVYSAFKITMAADKALRTNTMIQLDPDTQEQIDSYINLRVLSLESRH
jgi:predicted dehydrogenase